MKSKSIFTALLFLLLTAPLLLAQNLKIGIGGGYGRIFDDIDYSSSMGDDPFPTQLGLRNWFIINSVVKFIPERIPVIFTGEINYLASRNNANYSGYYSPLQSGPIKMNLDAAQDVFSAGIGFELPVIRDRRLTPYFSLGLTANYFGETQREWRPDLSPLFLGGGTLNTTSVISSSFRGGLDLGIGAEYALSPKMGLDISAQYNFMNLVGQNDASEWEKEEDFNMFTVMARLLYCPKTR